MPYIKLLIGVLLFVYILGSMIAMSMNYSLKNKGLKGIEWYECFSVYKQFNVAIGFVLKSIIPFHIFEQYVLRFYDEDCKPCLDKGKCLYCGCDTKAKMWAPGEEDSNDNWGKIIWSKKEYEKYRKRFPVQIKTEYKNGSTV